MRSTLPLYFFLLLCLCSNTFAQPKGFNINRQEQLLKKGNLGADFFNVGPGYANRIFAAYYDNEIISGLIFSSAISYMPVDRLKIKLEFGGFSEGNQMFNDYSKPGHEYNNDRIFGIVSISYFPVKKPLWFSAGAGCGNYQFNRIKDPVLTKQGTYTTSSIVNFGFMVQGGVGYDIILLQKLKTGIMFTASYLFMDDLKFVTGETLPNDEGSLVIGLSVSLLSLIITYPQGK
jgi:hypothetical protein